MNAPMQVNGAAVRALVEAYRQSHCHTHAFACCSAHAAADTVPDLLARIAELEAEADKVAEFVAARAEVITAIRNCHPDNVHDYQRWQGHAESRRQLAETLGLPVAWPAKEQS